MEEFRSYQQNLLKTIMQKHPYLSDKVCEAFLKVPRHLFVQYFSKDRAQWINLKQENLNENLPLLYADTSLLLYRDPERECVISQPSLVLWMLDKLDLRPGEKVFEIGAGSGWNAALMGELVGPTGKVISMEIIEEMTIKALQNMQKIKMPQVHVLQGDGSIGHKEEAPFDRGVFTAGAYDIPSVFYEQIREGGKLLFVLKIPDNYDYVLVLKKIEGHFEEIDRLPCLFVPLTGEVVPHRREKLKELAYARHLRIYEKHDVPLRGQKEKLLKGENSNFLFY